MFNFQYSNNSILDLRLPLQIETSAANHEKRKFEVLFQENIILVFSLIKELVLMILHQSIHFLIRILK